MEKLFKLGLLLLITILGVACARVERGGDNNGGTGTPTNYDDDSIVVVTAPDNVKVTATPKPSKPQQTLHVFIENSGSMNGYINQASDFQMAIGRAIQLMEIHYGENNIKTYYVNQNIRERIRPDGTDIYQFVQNMLDKKNFTTSGTGKADRGTTATNLNDIVKRVLDSVDENNTAVLISDFIYSLPSTNGTTTSLLYECQNLTMYALLRKTKALKNTSLATNLIQLYSFFDGKYWHWEKPTGKDYVELNCKRPYYMCVLGTDDNVKEFNRSINIEELKGYMNQFTISNKDVSNANYTVFDTKYKVGSYRHNNSSAIHDVTKASKNNVGKFEMGIAIDLSDFSMSETDKLDVANYEVGKGNYKISKIEAIDTTLLANPLDKKLIRDNHCTHAIIVSATGFPNDLSISIKRHLPQWIRNASSVDDRTIATDQQEQLKTFGISYFVEGISDAYKYLATNENNFMTINITVKK